MPEQLAEMLNAASKFNEPDFWSGLLRGFDKVQNLWKSYSVMSPGFHWRNNLGSFIQNAMDGVDYEVYGFVHRVHRAARKARRKARKEGREATREEIIEGVYQDKKLPREVKDAYADSVNMGIGKTGQVNMEVNSGISLFPQGGRFERLPVLGRLAKPSSANPFSPEFWPSRVSRDVVGESMESWHREAAFIDTYMKTGGDSSEAFARTMKLHFDYADMSAVERSVMRRLMPFYLWNRRNLSLQLGFIVSQPARVNRYWRVKANIEAMSQEEDQPVPAYFFTRMGIRMPESYKLPFANPLFGDSPDGRAYAVPDLPLNSLFELQDPDQYVAHISPMLKTPYEFLRSRRMWKDIPLSDEYQPMPRGLTVIPGLVPVLEKLPLGPWSIQRDEDGKPMMRERYAYALESQIPVLGQLRRLAPDPDDPAYGERQLQSWLSWAMGINFRTNIYWESRSELFARWNRFQDEMERLDRAGYDPAEAEQKALKVL
jgi:hypothetical protein